MLRWLKELDRILRGDATKVAALRQGTIPVLAEQLTAGILVLGLIYGLCMGSYAVFIRDEPEFRQLLASMLKVPALLFLSVLVTFPSLYVFSALAGCRLTLPAMLRLMVVALSVLAAVLASLGPIVAFFSLTTANYSFMVLLNIVVFAVAWVLGVGFLLQALHRLSELDGDTNSTPSSTDPDTAVEPAPTGRVVPPFVKLVFYFWVVIFAVVGAQMSWVLRPMIGNPEEPFMWFSPRDSSHFLDGLGRAFIQLFR
jgi:hypothetical protein